MLTSRIQDCVYTGFSDTSRIIRGSNTCNRCFQVTYEHLSPAQARLDKVDSSRSGTCMMMRLTRDLSLVPPESFKVQPSSSASTRFRSSVLDSHACRRSSRVQVTTYETLKQLQMQDQPAHEYSTLTHVYIDSFNPVRQQVVAGVPDNKSICK